MLLSYPVRGGEPAVEALKVGALPEGGLKRYPRCWVSGVAPNAPKADADPRSDAGERR
jgi:hypothetical protein